MNEFPEYGYVREWQIVSPKGPLPISRSTGWAGVKSGRFPQPAKLGPRITAWRAEDIRYLVANGLESSKSNTRDGERDE